MLIPNITRTWAPRGHTPLFYHLYKQDRISAITALVVSPKRRRLALFLTLHPYNLTGLDIRSFLKPLLKHLRGPVVLLWDGGTIHRRTEVKQYIIQHPRLHVEPFPGYAPELNPTEFVWNQTDHRLFNIAPESVPELDRLLRNTVRKIRHSQKLLWACIYASDLPWKR